MAYKDTLSIQKRRPALTLLGFLLALSLLPWLLIQPGQAMNTDIAWLTEAALRLLSGQMMSEGYYDPNPPLSILVQVPPAILSPLGMPVYYAAFLYSLVLLLLSAFAVNHIFKKTGWLAPEQIRLLLAVYILANTVAAGLYFGERDHYVALGLLPFVLLQAATTQKISFGKNFTWAVLILGATAILLKPHYIFIPFVLLAHRAWTDKRTFLHDRDFRVLAVALLSYAGILGLFFRDYLTIILPDVLTLYVPLREDWVLTLSAGLAAILGGFIVVSYLLFKPPQRIAAALFLLSLFCLVPFVLQGKGFYYHALPAAIFLLCGLSILIEKLTFAFFEVVKPGFFKRRTASALAFLYFMSAVYKFAPPNMFYPTHENYRSGEAAQTITACKECSFFMFNDMMEIIHPLALYTGHTHASRFPSYWFLPRLLQEHSTLSPEEVERYKKKYAGMVTEDFRKYRPGIVMIGRFKTGDTNKPFDFPDFFGNSDPEFEKIWQDYRKDGEIVINHSAYFGGTLMRPDSFVIYDVYKRRD